MEAKTEEVLRRLVLAAPAITDKFYDTYPNRCLMMARIGTNVLDYFGIRSRPVMVNVLAGNRAWYDWMGAGMPGGTMPEGAWSVGAHENDTSPSIYGDKGLNGHVVLEVEGMLVDLDLRQFSRPEKGFEFPDAAGFNIAPDFWERKPQEFFVGENAVLVYIRQDSDAPERYKNGGDWKRPYKELCGFLIRMIRQDIHAHARETA